MRGREWIFVIFLTTSLLGLCKALNLTTLFGESIDEKVRRRFEFSKYCKPQPEPLGLYNGTIANEQMSAPPNSWARQREPWRGRLYHNSAWQAETSDYKQYLQVDLLHRHVIMGVATQGMQGSDHWVTSYRVLYSNDDKNWSPVTEKNGEPKLFVGNNNAESVKMNILEFPIVARYVRINPQLWKGFIALRMEIYGCRFESFQASFDGKGIIKYDMTGPQYQLRTRDDNIRLRFRTVHPFGVLFYASSSQGDYIAIELYRGILKVSINLGTTESDIYAGSLLDDNQWHDVEIVRESRECNVTVDRLKTVKKLSGEFLNLDVDDKLYLGGLETFTHVHGIKTKENFVGCIENLYFNDLNMIRDAKAGYPRYSGNKTVNFQCQLKEVTSITLDSSDPHVEFEADGDKGKIKVSFTFRTYNSDGIMVYYEYDTFKFQVKLDENAHIVYSLSTSPSIEDIVLNTDKYSLSDGFNDGLWHTVYILADINRVIVRVDNQERITTQTLKMDELGDGMYMIGAGPEGYQGFVGCMQDIVIGTKSLNAEDLTKGAKHGVVIGGCSMRDQCHPNPCEHGGACSQVWTTFSCDCEGTGYTGAVCHRSIYQQSCTDVRQTKQNVADTDEMIDVDGSGPLEPFMVTCNFQKGIETWVLHKDMGEVVVDGFQDPGSYRRKIIYNGSRDQLTALVERAERCEQSIMYKCKNSKLLAYPGSPFQETMSYGWWISRTSQPMYYWGNAAPGTYKCTCGVEGTCHMNMERCNCDSGDENAWLTDDGLLQNKEFLPVMELHLGDTGTLVDNKQGVHKLGALKCTGDSLYENTVTFRKADAAISFPPLQFDEIDSLDIKFQFRTTALQGTFLHATAHNQFLELSYHSGTTVQFRFNVGRGVEAIEVVSSSKLNDGSEWHTIIVERNRKEYFLKVDLLAPVTRPEPVNQGYRNFWLETNLTVGATVEYRNGFIGCMRSLQVNGEMYDLLGAFLRNETTYGLSAGCVPKCKDNPCINNGICKEGFSNYECDCTFTPFRGYVCGREVGTNMASGDMIKYTFDPKGSLATEEEDITIGFATQAKKGILMKIINPTPGKEEYISIELNNNGGITVYFNFGQKSGGRDTISTEVLEKGVDLTNNQQHIVKFRRTNSGRKLTLQVDEYTPAVKELTKLAPGADAKLNNPKFIYIGRDENTETGYGFHGCIYRAKFNNIYPLKLAFYDPKPDNIMLDPSDLPEDKCGFEEVLPKPEPFERRPEFWNITIPTTGETGSSGINAAILGAILAALFILLIVFVIIVVCLITRQKGEYKTQEAKGTEGAENPDFAMLQARTGQPEVSRKPEIFI